MINAYINGKFFSEKEAQISPFDLGFLRGCGVFEYFRTYEKYPFLLQKRLKRLQNAAKEIGISLRLPLDEIKNLVYTLIKKNGFSESAIRIIATKGISVDGLTPKGESSLIITTTPFQPYSKAYYEKGIRAITTHHKRTLPHIKSLNYLPALLALEEAKAENAQEALYLNEKGEILEGTTSNFFAFKNDTLITANTDHILPGMTRGVVLDLAREHFPILLDSPVVSGMGEAFITSSLKEIVPVVAIDGKKIGTGKPGKNTQFLMELFRTALYELALN